MAAVPPVSPFVTGGLFGVSALTGVLSFMSELKAANDHNEYINALKKAQPSLKGVAPKVARGAPWNKTQPEVLVDLFSLGRFRLEDAEDDVKFFMD